LRQHGRGRSLRCHSPLALLGTAHPGSALRASRPRGLTTDSTAPAGVESRAVPASCHQSDRLDDVGASLMFEPTPCDRRRPAERCKAKLLACHAFGLLVAGASPIAWNVVNRSPTRELYEALL